MPVAIPRDRVRTSLGNSLAKPGLIAVALLFLLADSLSHPVRAGAGLDQLSYVGHNEENPFHCMDVEIVGNRAYVANGLGLGLETYDITNPAAMVRLNRIGPPVWRSRAFGSKLYAFCHISGLTVFDISGATTLVGSYDPPAAGVSYEGGTLVGTDLFVAAHQVGIHVLDVSNLGTISQSSTISLGNNAAWAVIEVGGRLLVANGRFGLAVVDPVAETVTATLALPGLANDLVLHENGNLAVVSLGTAGIATVDVTNPDDPQQLGIAPTAGNATGLGILGDRVVVGSYVRLETFDVSDPSNPVLEGWDHTATWAMGADIEDDGGSGLVIVADWRGISTYRPIADASPDIEVALSRIDFGTVATTSDTTLTVYNRGSADLIVTNVLVPSGFSVAPNSFTIPAGGLRSATLTATGATAVRGTVRYFSNDPDEATYRQPVYKNNTTFLDLGSPAPDFTLNGTDALPHTLSDQLGKVVFLEFGANW